jgi:serine/threonine protein kinase/tetratricopeptide (TPR) repeat protein
MNVARFQQIETLYHAAREATTDERAALLARADPELRHEVELLLSEQNGAEFLDRPAIEHAPDLLEDAATVQLEAGARLGPYRIEHKLGEGGMGEVFRAIDTRLGRAVAIKITRVQFSARFEREARAIAALNHPNICTLYDVGPNYFVMELVEGETLAARLKRGPLPMNTALSYASQIAAALAEAHARGIVHRDLKPGNLMVARSSIKVLDFGLAKSSHDQTVTASRTVTGTPGYMAPEQREGKPADARTDIYAFGCVLYEMLAGERLLLPRRRLSSRKLERIVNRCLEEAPGRRWQSAAELQRALAATTPASRATPVAITAGAILVLSAAAAYFYLHQAPKLTSTDTIVLAEFTNTTGDPVFDDTLRQGLAVQLQQSPFLSLISEERIRSTLPLMNQPADARLTPDLAQGVCARTGSTAVLEGSIAALGSQYVLGLRAKHCTTGDILADEQAQAARKEEVLSTLGQIADRFRTRVGESLATIEKHSTPLEEATTPSLEALKAFNTGRNTMLSAGWERRLPHLQRAIAIDPEFAMAHALVGFGYSSMGESALGRQSLVKAYQLRSRASDVERLNIETLYDRDVTGNLDRERRTLETWAESYPRDPRPQSLMAGLALTSTGQYELAIAQTEKAIALEAGAPTYASKARNQLLLNRLDDALLTVRRAAERKLESDETFLVSYFVAFLKGDDEELSRAATVARNNPGSEDIVSHLETLALARSGRLQDARRMSAVPVEIAQRSGRRERAGLFEAGRAVWEAFYGNAAAARQSAAKALKLGRGRDVDYAAAFALALSGDLPQSRALAEDLAREAAEDTSVQFMYLPTLRALFSLNAGDPAAAIQALQIASRYDLALGRVGFIGRFGGLYPIYARGLAYLAARQPTDAAVEFQRILDHRSIVLVDPMDAMARLQLARALALSGDTVKAKGVYNDLLTLWKNADPDIRVLKDAQAEYARLPD